jgi:hypothetical protein
MNQIRRLSLIAATVVAVLCVAIPTLAAVLPVYEIPNYGISALLLCGALVAFFFAHRRLAN